MGGGKGKGGSSQPQPPTRQAILTGHESTVTCLSVDEEHACLYSGSTDGTVRVWTWAAGGFAEKFAGGIPAGGAIECLLLFHPWLFAGLQAPAGTAGLVRVWQVETGGDQSLQGHMGTVFCLEQGGSYLFSGGEDLGLKVWQYSEAPAVPGAPSTLGSFVPAIELKGHQACIQDMKVTGGSAERAADVLISADRGGTVALWGFGEANASPNPLKVFQTGHNNLMGIWLEAEIMFTAGLDGHVKVWDGQGTQLYDHVCLGQQGGESGVTALAVVPDQADGVMVTACQDKAIKLWQMPKFSKRGILGYKAGHTDVVRCIAKGPGNSFFTGSMDKTICVWEMMS